MMGSGIPRVLRAGLLGGLCSVSMRTVCMDQSLSCNCVSPAGTCLPLSLAFRGSGELYMGLASL